MTKEEFVLLQREIFSKVFTINDSEQISDTVNYLKLVIGFLENKNANSNIAVTSDQINGNVAITVTPASSTVAAARNPARNLSVHEVAKAVINAQAGKSVGLHNN